MKVKVLQKAFQDLIQVTLQNGVFQNLIEKLINVNRHSFTYYPKKVLFMSKCLIIARLVYSLEWIM